jgi:DNA-binding GntR family transcriptional regulator
MFDRSSLSEQVEIALKKEITSGRMQPGQRVSTSDLRAAWKISSTPFRDAVRALENQGFVTVEPRKGIYVATMDADAVKEIFDLRIALECMAVERATPLVPAEEASRVLHAYLQAEQDCKAGKLKLDHMTDRLVHDLAWNHCGNRRLQKALASHRELIHWAQCTIIRKQPDAYRIALPEHIRIMHSICAGDAEAAAHAMRTHLECSSVRLCAQLMPKDPDFV